ncbi:hypothetical protein CF386_11070 [Paraphotobacterium marinum]|uniref:Histidine phosphatase family protein n=1 Tax=Paraphotobacterium marinum TaxID=1755811 RepID=A0A220VGV1_9GAMM|nr:hypothetical protein [Paraphotobacterium marinum]ASK79587.1 hypothetical protein CF386_11070 [Paraphotobacterium marinum]
MKKNLISSVVLSAFIASCSYQTSAQNINNANPSNAQNLESHTQVIVLFRHGEKAQGKYPFSGNNLSNEGTERSLLLPAYFSKVLGAQLQHYQFPKVILDAKQQSDYGQIQQDYHDTGKALRKVVGNPNYIMATSTDSYWSSNFYTRPFTTVAPFANSIDKSINGSFYIGWTAINSYVGIGSDYLGCYNPDAKNTDHITQGTPACKPYKFKRQANAVNKWPTDITTEVLNNWDKRVIKSHGQSYNYEHPDHPNVIDVESKNYRNSVTYISWEHDQASNLAQGLIERLMPEKAVDGQVSKENLMKLVSDNYNTSQQSRAWANNDYGMVYVFVIHWKQHSKMPGNTYTNSYLNDSTVYSNQVKKLEVYRVNESLPKTYQQWKNGNFEHLMPILPASKNKEYSIYIKNFLKQTSPNSLTPIRPEWDAQAKTWPNEVEKYHRGTIVMKAINGDNAMFRCDSDAKSCQNTIPGSGLTRTNKSLTLQKNDKSLIHWKLLCHGSGKGMSKSEAEQAEACSYQANMQLPS